MADQWATLRPLPEPKCGCGKRATHELFNSRNGSHGKFCGSCGRAALAKLKKDG